MGTPYYMYTPLEHTITNVLWGVFVCTLIALIVVWVSKSRRIKQLKADIQRLQDGLVGKSNAEEQHHEDESEKTLWEQDEIKHNSFRSTVVNWFLNLSVFARFILTLVLSAMPFAVLGLPWWADVLIVLGIQSIPIIGTVGHLSIYIWALVVEIQSDRFDVWSVLFYISFALFIFALVVPLVLLLFGNKDRFRKHNASINWKNVVLALLIIGMVTLFAVVVIPVITSPDTHIERETAVGYPLITFMPSDTPKPTPRPTNTPIPTPYEPTERAFPARNMAIGANGEGYCGVLKVTASSTHKYTILSIVELGETNACIIAYIRGGDTLEIEVPYGTYKIYCAEGDKYYGALELFGGNGMYSVLDDTFRFYEDDEYIYGHTLSLYSTYSGNLDSDTISFKDFPK